MWSGNCCVFEDTGARGEPCCWCWCMGLGVATCGRCGCVCCEVGLGCRTLGRDGGNSALACGCMHCLALGCTSLLADVPKMCISFIPTMLVVMHILVNAATVRFTWRMLSWIYCDPSCMLQVVMHMPPKLRVLGCGSCGSGAPASPARILGLLDVWR